MCVMYIRKFIQFHIYHSTPIIIYIQRMNELCRCMCVCVCVCGYMKGTLQLVHRSAE